MKPPNILIIVVVVLMMILACGVLGESDPEVPADSDVSFEAITRELGAEEVATTEDTIETAESTETGEPVPTDAPIPIDTPMLTVASPTTTSVPSALSIKESNAGYDTFLGKISFDLPEGWSVLEAESNYIKISHEGGQNESVQIIEYSVGHNYGVKLIFIGRWHPELQAEIDEEIAQIMDSLQIGPHESLPTSTPTRIDTSVSQCETDKWEIIPTALYIIEKDRAPNYKILLVPIAVANYSQYPALLNRPGNQIQRPFVTTETGLSYKSTTLTAEPEYTYLADNHPGIGEWYILSRLGGFIPSGIVMHGYAGHSEDTPANLSYGNPDQWLQLVFSVPEAQNHFELTIPSIEIECLLDSRELVSETIGPFVFDLNTDIRDAGYPTSLPDSELGDFDEPIDLGDGKILELLGIKFFDEIEGRTISLQFRYTNSSTDLEPQFNLGGYLIGSDGLLRSMSASVTAGFGESTDFEFRRLVGDLAEGFKLGFLTSGGRTSIVYDLPE